MSVPRYRIPATIVIGVGTELRGDAGFGAAVIEALRDQPVLGGRVQLAHCDGEPSRMIELWDGYSNALVVDAVRGGAERFGFLYRHDLTPAGDRRPSREPRAAPGRETGRDGHTSGFGSALRLGGVLDRLPGRLILCAVHGRDFRPGAPLSPPVALVVPQLAVRITREILGVLSVARRDEDPAGHR